LSAVKTVERLRARELRASGYSVKEIERALGVARSSVSRWVADVPLGEEERRALAERVKEGRLQAAERKAARARAERLKHQDAGRRRAREGDASYVSGCMLYWAEGEKSLNRVGIVNSDPGLLSFFASFLRKHFGVKADAMSIYCNLFADHLERQWDIEQFWLDTLGLPQSSLRKSVVNTYSKYSAKKRVNKLPYGTCKLVVHSTAIVQTIFGSIQEYSRFEHPEWLD
jgi:transcriptional regulator with XRE-family HTH domain